ncbi:MAG: hypothetical protein WA814_04660 [Candidatus Baltobacteraceae bacterium]
MKISMRAIGICLSTAVLVGCLGHVALIPTQPQADNQLQVRSSLNAGFDNSAPTFLTLPSRNVDFSSLDAQRDASLTIQFYSGTIKSPLDNVVYSYRIVGSDPVKSNATTNVLYKPIALRVHFADGTVLDPSKPACGDTVSVKNRALMGPNFAPVPLTSNGVNVGKVQITDGFQRAEFWKVLKGPRYHTVLKTVGAIIVDVNAPAGSSTHDGVCSGRGHRIGAIDVDAMNRIIVNLAQKRVKPNQIALFLTYNTFETYNGRCCIGGFHSAFGADGTRVYTIATYNDSGIFKQPTSADIDTLTHELGDLLDNPFPLSDTKANSVPPWGGVGQVPKGSCQGNLETGDPLTGTQFEVRYNGFTYHPQQLAFFSWFYRTKSIGTGGKFSFKGKFTRTQGLCIGE